jgi:hypothetical protein
MLDADPPAAATARSADASSVRHPEAEPGRRRPCTGRSGSIRASRTRGAVYGGGTVSDARLRQPNVHELSLELSRAADILVRRLRTLHAEIEAGRDDAWSRFCEVVSALAAVAAHGVPGRRGELLTTAEMAARLRISPKTLLRHRAEGKVQAAIKSGKLIRWRGDERSQ